ncbi:hypothetical protein [Gracilibacillus xinjiangensis]|uniref:Uncharacterized protein n=1 Tax=Gracilibacillus xinjiangensis TaxID=1193282 RepID=A0ABV8WXM9_9BACI
MISGWVPLIKVSLYEAMGGVKAGEGSFEVTGVKVKDVIYGWEDISRLGR